MYDNMIVQLQILRNNFSDTAHLIENVLYSKQNTAELHSEFKYLKLFDNKYTG